MRGPDAHANGASPVVIKLGGRALEADGAAAELAAEIAPLTGEVLLVHGGGAEVSQWCERLGHAPRFENGLRVTDAPTLDVAAAVLAGLANKRLVAALRKGGADAVGLSALDGGMVFVRPHRDSATLGAVGEVTKVAPGLLSLLLADRRVPVIASIAASEGALLNLNADDLAASLAAALGARALILISDVPGVVLGNKVAAYIARADLDQAIDSPEVAGGMRPKLNAGRVALDGGVQRVHIAAWTGPGTLRKLMTAAGGTVLIPTEAEGSHD